MFTGRVHFASPRDFAEQELTERDAERWIKLARRATGRVEDAIARRDDSVQGAVTLQALRHDERGACQGLSFDELSHAYKGPGFARFLDAWLNRAIRDAPN